MNAKLENALYAPLGWLFHAIALLPLRVLYVVSDVLQWVACDVLRYRRPLVEQNIAASFPELTAKEQRKIVRGFYKNFTDVFIETIKLLHISDKEMRRRMVFEGCEQIDALVKKGIPVGVFCSHFCNWEWITSIVLYAYVDEKVKYSQIYRPLRNKWFDRFYLSLRSRFHTDSIAKNAVLRELITVRKAGAAFVTGFISDQKPSHNDGLHSIRFLNQDTPFITGSELLLRKFHAAAFYADVERVKRGYYRIKIIHITDDVSLTEEYAVTDRYGSLLETSIRRQPEAWLWSHNRWRRPHK